MAASALNPRIRLPAVAGLFYPSDRKELDGMLASLLSDDAGPQAVKAVVAPHAGYKYSGAVAGQVFARIEIPERVAILGPNHRGIGPDFAVFPPGVWKTPIGDATIDERLTRQLLDGIQRARSDESAHLEEHSVEVEVNFMLKRRPDVRLACVVVGDLTLAQAQEVGDQLASAVRSFDHAVLLVASTDLSHFLADAEARKRDRRAIDAILALDEAELWRRVVTEDISMCGYIPTAIVMRAAKALGATCADLAAYATSADASGDTHRVVGYAGVLLN
ncbi:MAG: AmmeMemoRadiSam system protein B [bacterium]